MKMPTKKVLFVKHPVELIKKSLCTLKILDCDQYLSYCAFTEGVWGQAEQRRNGKNQHIHLQTVRSSSSKRWGEQDTECEAPLLPLLQRKAAFVSVFTKLLRATHSHCHVWKHSIQWTVKSWDIPKAQHNKPFEIMSKSWHALGSGWYVVSSMISNCFVVVPDWFWVVKLPTLLIKIFSTGAVGST